MISSFGSFPFQAEMISLYLLFCLTDETCASIWSHYSYNNIFIIFDLFCQYNMTNAWQRKTPADPFESAGVMIYTILLLIRYDYSSTL